MLEVIELFVINSFCLYFFDFLLNCKLNFVIWIVEILFDEIVYVELEVEL